MKSCIVRLGLLSALLAQSAGAQGHVQEGSADCGFEQAADGMREHMARLRSAGVERQLAPSVRPRDLAPTAPAPTVSEDDIYAYEDTASLLLTDFSIDDLHQMMVDSANELMLTHGDNFDFIGYMLNFTADHTVGAAFYSLIENDVDGIGDIGAFAGEPLPTFDLRPDLGLGGSNIEGFVMMWNVNSWVPGAGPSAAFTRLVLGQEFEHRFAMFLPPLLDGRVMQGDNSSCGRAAHWSWRVDGQGSGMEIREWVAASPALLSGSSISFNTDIPSGVFSYTDLYLMGYVNAAEMDAGNSELRFMEGSDCSSSFSGTISAFSSADIIASAGARVPDSSAEDKDYRTGWIMFHLPGAPPSMADRTRAAGILNQHSSDWNASTLGLGNMDNTLPPPLALATLYNGSGLNQLCLSSKAPVMGQVWCSSIDTTVRAMPTSALLVVYADRGGGLFLSGGEVLVDLSSGLFITTQQAVAGPSSDFLMNVPSDPALAGLSATAQGVVFGGGFTLCNAYRITVGF